MSDNSDVAPIADQVMGLRKQGWNYGAIAEALGITKAEVKAIVTAGLKSASKETVRQVMALENERLDTLLTAVFPAAEKGDLLAVDRVLKIMERRARILGLDQEKTKARAGGPSRLGKKAQRQAMAEKSASGGKFAVPSSPKLAVDNT